MLCPLLSVPPVPSSLALLGPSRNIRAQEIVPKAHATAASSGACSKWAACPRPAPEFPIHMSPPVRLSTISIILLVLCPLSSPGPFSCCNPRSLPNQQSAKECTQSTCRCSHFRRLPKLGALPQKSLLPCHRQPAQIHHHLADALPLCPPCQLSHSRHSHFQTHTAPLQTFQGRKDSAKIKCRCLTLVQPPRPFRVLYALLAISSCAAGC